MTSRRGRIHRTGVSNLDTLSLSKHREDPYKLHSIPFANALKDEDRSLLLSQSAELSRVEKRKIIQSISPPPKTARKPPPGSVAVTPLPDLSRSRSVPRKPKVSLHTIDTAKRALRQRYVNRSNFRKIFNLWDRGNLGYIRPEDVHYMTNKLGIGISQEEAELLVASANRSKTGKLNLDEFLELLFSEEPELSSDAQIQASDLETVRATLEERAIQQREKNVDGILKNKIKSRLHELTQDMVKRDLDGKGVISFPDFCVVMDSLKLPNEISNLSQWEKVYDTMGGGPNGLDYRVFAEKFKQIGLSEKPKNPLVDEYSQKMKPVVKVPVSSHAVSIGNYTVLDGQKVPVNTLESIQIKARKLKRFLRSRYETEDALKQELARIGEGDGIPLGKLKTFMNYEALKEPGDTVSKRDIEGFLSAFQYNSEGNADVKAVARSIFSEEFRDDTLNRKTRAMPPAKARGPESVSPLPTNKLQTLLTELEKKLYVQRSEQAYQAFKIFDVDGDGYVSSEDFEKGLKSLNIVHEPQEAQQLMDFLDENKNGFLSFKEFAKGVRPDMVTSHAKRLLGSEVSPALQPSKEFYQRHLTDSKQHAKDHEQARQAYIPDGKTPDVYPPTRYGLRPDGNMTKDVFQPPSTASMYIDEKARFQRKNLQPISLTQEDKDRRSRLKEAKLSVIKEFRGREADQIAQLEEAVQEHKNRKVWQKAYVKEEYEKVVGYIALSDLPCVDLIELVQFRLGLASTDSVAYGTPDFMPISVKFAQLVASIDVPVLTYG